MITFNSRNWMDIKIRNIKHFFFDDLHITRNRRDRSFHIQSFRNDQIRTIAVFLFCGEKDIPFTIKERTWKSTE